MLNKATANVLSQTSSCSPFFLVEWLISCPQTAALLRAQASACFNVSGDGGLDMIKEDRLFII